MTISPRAGLALAALSLALAAATAAAATGKPAPIPPLPVAQVVPVVDDYFGTKVTDDYRWMEDRGAPAFVAWAKAENAHARAVIDRIPGRDELQRRIAARTGGGTLVSGIRAAGGKLFYGKREPTDNSVKLYVREGAAGPERLLVDPDAIPTTGPHYALDYYEPSDDGSHLAYAVSPGGSEASVIHVLDVATGKDGPETIARAEQGSPSWLPDGKSFFYNRYVLLGPGAKETDKYQNSRAMLHVVGTDPASDVALAGTGVAGSPPVDPVDTPVLVATPGSDQVVLVVNHGASPAQTYWVAPLAAARQPGAAWKKVADVADEVADIQVHGDRLFLQSLHGTPRGQILEVDARAPDVAHARVVVAAGPRVIEQTIAAADAFYVVDLDAGLGRIRRVGYDDGNVADVALPMAGTVSTLAADASVPGLIFSEQGWVTPPRFFRTVDGQASPLPLAPPWREDLGAYTSEEVMATAADGTRIPLSIVHRKDVKPDGKRPVWLTGYGAYGISLKPTLASRYLTLLDDGGVYAVAHVRGGGEFGEDWHQAGRLATKTNTPRDLIACAEYLVKRHWTQPSLLAISGGSAGGITVGMALTERPDLFRVVFSAVGDSNTLRTEQGTDGPANSLEYGSTANEAGFKALYAVDSTQHVRAGVRYPAVLLTTGMNDPRVAPWQPGKMTAHLQAANPHGRPVLLLVDFDAGHGIGSTKSQRDRELADQMAFFYWQIGKRGYQPTPPARR
jgi:prolyl oligopeptidase